MFEIQGLLSLALSVVLFGVKAFALVDCVARKPAQFVDELYERWNAQNPPEVDRAATATPAVESVASHDNTLFEPEL